MRKILTLLSRFGGQSSRLARRLSLPVFGGLVLAVLCNTGFSTPINLANVNGTMSASGVTIAQIIEGVCIFSGVTSICTALYKFHSHKVNPQQMTLTGPFVFLFCGAALLLYPHLITTSLTSIYGKDAKVNALASGTSISASPGMRGLITGGRYIDNNS